MRKKRKIWSIVLGLLGGMTLINVILFIVGVFSPLVFWLVLSAQIIASALIIARIIVLTKKLKIKLLERAASDIPIKNPDDPTEIYKILGIPVQFDGDGRVLTIYELLGIVPLFDENGKRIKTIYEELEVNPTFNKDGKEIPTVVILKNRTDKVAKVKSANATVFVRKLTPEQREKLILLKMLREKREEAEKKGDKEKVAKIDVAIKKVAPKKKENIEAAKSKPIKPVDASKIKIQAVKYGKSVGTKIEKADGGGTSKDKSSSSETTENKRDATSVQSPGNGSGGNKQFKYGKASMAFDKTVVTVAEKKNQENEEEMTN